MPPGPKRTAALQALHSREAEEASTRLRQLHGITFPADHFMQKDGDEPFAITVKMLYEDELSCVVYASTTCVALKLQLYEEGVRSADGVVPPPTVARLMLGDVELLDGDSLADHDVQEGATCTLVCEAPLRVSLEGKERPFKVWSAEVVENALKRLGILDLSRWRVDGSEEAVDVHKTVSQCGIQDGAALVQSTQEVAGLEAGMTVGLETHTGRWVNVKNDSTQQHTTIWTAHNGQCPASLWTIEVHGEQVAFRSQLSGQYANVKNAGGAHTELWTCTSSEPAASKFTPVRRGQKYAFRAHDGHWMNVKNDGDAHVPIWTAHNGECPASLFSVKVHAH